MSNDAAPDPENRETTAVAQLFRWHVYAALAAVLYVALLGLLMAIKLHHPDLLGGLSWLTWGRIRAAHTQGVFFGWLGNAFLAFLYYAVPRLAGRPVTSVVLGWTLYAAWNGLVVLPGSVLVHAGICQALEWAEFPLPVDAAATVGLGLAFLQFALPLLRARLTGLYVSAWYVLGGLTFTLLAYPVGNVAPELLPGAEGATISGLWIHDAVGLYVTPLALAVAYAVIPAVTRQPIFSHFWSMIGFWLLFLVYPLNGTHHYIFSSIPMDAQKGAIVASVYLGVAVIVVVTNLLLSIRGATRRLVSDVPLRFVWLGVICYLVVGLQGSAQALMGLNRFIHFTDWVIGHAHLAMIGFASFIAIGGVLHASRRLPGCRFSAPAAAWSFWLLAGGLAIMVFDLTAAGLVQGFLWRTDLPWQESVDASHWFWVARSASGLILLAGFVTAALAVLTGKPTEAVAVPPPAEKDESHDVPAGLRWLKEAYVLTGGAGLAFFLLSFVVLGVYPNRVLRGEMTAAAPLDREARSRSELLGRRVYIREGCMHCHSQLVRSTADDVRRFGVASQAWETDGDFPQMWGTRRIGPDLAREGTRKSPDWHLAHLWNPRHVVPGSVMPGYPWLFEGTAAQPTSDALALVDYLESLGRDARLAGQTGAGSLPDGAEREVELRTGMFCDCAIPRTRGDTPVWSAPVGAGEVERYARRGAEVFALNCAGCHGDRGAGDGPAAEALVPRPRNLTAANFTDRTLSETLWTGKPGSSMPPWNELPASDLRGLVAFVRSLGPPDVHEQLSDEDRREAVKAYGVHCVVCHGSAGAGNGPAAGRLTPPPTNFLRVQPSRKYAEQVLATGIAGTAMPKWDGKLTLEQRRLLALYVRSFYKLGDESDGS
jgi:cytochrome c oxidase cbb3-type subunit I/II